MSGNTVLWLCVAMVTSLWGEGHASVMTSRHGSPSARADHDSRSDDAADFKIFRGQERQGQCPRYHVSSKQSCSSYAKQVKCSEDGACQMHKPNSRCCYDGCGFKCVPQDKLIHTVCVIGGGGKFQPGEVFQLGDIQCTCGPNGTAVNCTQMVNCCGKTDNLLTKEQANPGYRAEQGSYISVDGLMQRFMYGLAGNVGCNNTNLTELVYVVEKFLIMSANMTANQTLLFNVTEALVEEFLHLASNISCNTTSNITEIETLLQSFFTYAGLVRVGSVQLYYNGPAFGLLRRMINYVQQVGYSYQTYAAAAGVLFRSLLDALKKRLLQLLGG